MRRNRSAALAATFLILGASAITSAAVTTAAADPLPRPPAHDDFNADGYPDLVVSAPAATVNGQKDAGYVAVLYGSADDFSKTERRTVIDQSTAGVPGTPEAGDAFGTSTASGDLDADGFADLVVGAPGEDVGTRADAGSVTVLWGSAKGITGTSTVMDYVKPPAGTALGTGLAVGDFGGGYDTVAVLTKSYVTYFQMRDRGEAAATRQSSRSAASPASARATSKAGWPDGVTATGLTVGDFNRDRRDDIVTLGTITESGRTLPWGSVRFGGTEGPEREIDFPAGPVGDAGDVNHDGYDDLVASYPDQLDASGQDTTGGTVRVYFGGADGLVHDDPQRSQEVSQATDKVEGVSEPGDRFGSSISVANITDDGYEDVMIGGSGEDVGTAQDAGAVWWLPGSAAGLTGEGSNLFHQDNTKIPSVAEAGDEWGAQVRLIDGNGDGHADPVAAAPGENDDAGYVWVLKGRGYGVTATNSWSFSGKSLGAPYDGARFGARLAQ